MSRYIDADAISSFSGVIPKECDADSFMRGMEEVLKRAWSASTIDIVRCSECKYYEAKEDWCYWRDVYTEPEYFCSYGEVRDE